MELNIGGISISKYNEVAVSLRYDSIADTFSFKVYFDPDKADLKAALRPSAYKSCTITHINTKGEKETLIKGTLLSPQFTDAPVFQLATVAGYTVTGLLADCSVYRFIPNSLDNEVTQADNSIEFNNQNLQQIADLILSGTQFGKCVVDSTVIDECAKPFRKPAASPSQTIEDFLSTLACQRNVVLSHTNDGRVLFTKAASLKKKTKNVISAQTKGDNKKGTYKDRVDFNSVQTPIDAIFAFTTENKGNIWTNMQLSFNGQKMHSYIQVVGQKVDVNASDSNISNPYVQNTFRFRRSVQTSSDDNDTPDTARNILGEELKAITLTIDIVGWELGGRLVRPNTIITVVNPNCYLYNSNRWFIESVDFKGDAKSETATLNCVLPEVYNGDDVTNIFK